MATQDESIKAQLLVLHSAIGAIAAASENKQAILVQFQGLSERLMADLLAHGAASDAMVQSTQAHIQDFLKILRGPVPAPQKRD